MSYLTLLLAWLKSNSSDLTGTAWNNLFFDNLVYYEEKFFHFFLWIGGVALAIVVIAAILSLITKNKAFLAGAVGLGCFIFVPIVLAAAEWITLLLARGMATNYGPDGVIHQGKFIGALILYLLFGIG